MMKVNQYGIRRSGLHAIVDWLEKCGLGIEPYKTDFQRPLSARQHARLTYRCFEDAPLSTIEVERQRSDVFHFWTLRDPYNWLASRIAKGGMRPYVQQSLNLWISYAEKIRDLDYAPWINFTRWFDDATYRIECAKLFGLETDGSPFEGVSGRGSSFTARLHDGSASRMPVNDRWRVYSVWPSYRKMFTADVQMLGVELFGMTPPWQS